MMHEMDEISLNVHSDFLDEGHLNRTGQEKFTRYMAEHGYFG